jgi:hypothetical protein
MRIKFRFLVLPLLSTTGLAACANTAPPPPSVNGACTADAVHVDCTVNGLPGNVTGLQGYSCVGSARPDDNPAYIDGVPQGMICADRATANPDGGAAAPPGTKNYCCTANTMPCAYNPVAICEDPANYGFQCRGSSRPETLNPAISCTQGVKEGDLIDYCCSGTPRKHPCADYGGCGPGRTGWTCPANVLPSAQDLGVSQSRADLYYLLCPIPVQAPNPNYYNFCCFAAAPIPPSGTCIQDLKVPGCQAGRFGFACYGRDTPDQDFPSMTCADPGVPGFSEQGYPATVYCCDFKDQ